MALILAVVVWFATVVVLQGNQPASQAEDASMRPSEREKSIIVHYIMDNKKRVSVLGLIPMTYVLLYFISSDENLKVQAKIFQCCFLAIQ